MIMVSPRNRESVSIVAGFIVATECSLEMLRIQKSRKRTRVVICCRFIDNQAVRTANMGHCAILVIQLSTYDFLGRRIAVEVSLGLDVAAPLGSAILVVV